MMVSRFFTRTLAMFNRIQHSNEQKTILVDLARHASELATGSVSSVEMNTSPWLSIVVSVPSDQIDVFRTVLDSISTQNTTGIELLVLAGPKDIATLQDCLSGSDVPSRLLEASHSLNLTGVLRCTKGTLVTFLSIDERLTPNALLTIRNAHKENASMEFLYTDSLTVDPLGTCCSYNAKPAFDPVFFQSVDYISEAAFYARSSLQAVLSLKPQSGMSKLGELCRFFLSSVDAGNVFHLPFPAIQTQKTLGLLPKHSTRGESCESEYQGKTTSWPLVSIVIPSRNCLDLISQTLSSLYTMTDYPNFEVIVIDNGSDDLQVLDLYRSYTARHANFTVHIKNEPFNFSRSVNNGMTNARGEHILLLNNDIEVIEPCWLKEMVACLAYDRTGIVGAKLLYPNDKIQHAGVIIGLNGMASHWFYKENKNISGPMDRLLVRNSMSCVTGAVMLISGECREVLGDWDEENFAIAYNDVDYCLRARKAGFRTVWTPHASLYHHESASRGKDRSRQRKKQFQREKAALQRIHQTTTFVDPAFNPWLVRRPGPLKIQYPKAVPKTRTWWS